MSATTSSSDAKVTKAENFPDGTSDYVPTRAKAYDLKKPHMYVGRFPNETNMKWQLTLK